MANSTDNRLNAMWERDVLITFCDLCVAEVAAGNRPTTHFNREGWTNLVKSFERATGRRYEKTQLKNKWDHLKKDWKLWRELKRGSTGLGWDSSRKTIAASDEWWAEKLRIIPNAKKFRQGGIDPELEEKLELMFSGAVATGDRAWAPTQDEEAPVPVEHEDESTDVVGGPSGEPVVDHIGGSRGRQPHPGGSRNQTKKLKRSVFVREQITELVNSCKSTPSIASKKVGHCSLGEAIKWMEQIEEIVDDEPLWFFTIELLENPAKREIVMHLDQQHRLRYLRGLFDKRSG